MRQPLVIRPPYGETTTAESQLPEGEPAGRGVSMNDVSGYKTLAKPDDPTREHSKADTSIHRVDSPYDLAKHQTKQDEREQSGDTSYMGRGDNQNSPKTKYPYRDGVPNAHNAAAHFVAELYRLKFAPVRVFMAGAGVRVARKLGEILDGLNPKFLDRAQGAEVTVKRIDRKNLRWIFSVKGNHTYTVKLRAMRKGNVTQLAKMDLELSCTCPAWRWQGPEFHSTSEKYQLGKLQGTASAPDIRDPERQNFVCKHVAAVLQATKEWSIPLPKKAPKKAPSRGRKP
jgi:hypothetical protein